MKLPFVRLSGGPTTYPLPPSPLQCATAGAFVVHVYGPDGWAEMEVPFVDKLVTHDRIFAAFRGALKKHRKAVTVAPTYELL